MKRILEVEAEMERHIRAFHRSQHTLTVDICAADPLMELLPRATGIFSDMTVSSVIDTATYNFFKQEDIDAVGELTHFSNLPSFVSDITLKTMVSRQNDRIHIPFSDQESLATHYLICTTKNQIKVNPLFNSL